MPPLSLKDSGWRNCFCYQTQTSGLWHTHTWRLHRDRYTSWLFCVCVFVCVCVCVCVFDVGYWVHFSASSQWVELYSRLTSPGWPAAGFQLRGEGGRVSVARGRAGIGSAVETHTWPLASRRVNELWGILGLWILCCLLYRTACNWTCWWMFFDTVYLSLTS